MYQLFAPSRRHNRSDENETTSRNDRGCNINQCMHKIIIIARLHEIIPSVLNFNRISARLKWLPLLPFYRRFLLRSSSRDRSQLRLPPPSPFLIARYGMYLLTSLYALSYVIMQFVERSIVTSWLRFDQKVRKFEHSLNRGGAEVFTRKKFYRFLLTQMIHGWLRGDHEHFPVRREKFRGWDYAYRYFILVVCRMTATIVPSIPMCAMS